MNIKPAAMVYTDAAGKISGEVLELGPALEKFRRLTHGTELPPIGAVSAMILTTRGIEKRTKLTTADPPAVSTTIKPRKG